MTRTRRRPLGRRRLLTALFILASALIPGAQITEAHNNPGFKEVLLLRIEIATEPLSEGAFATYSEAFGLDLPKKSIELIWRVVEGTGESITFGVAKGDSIHADGLADGANSRILRGDDIRIINVAGAAEPFTIEIYANVIDRSKPADS